MKPLKVKWQWTVPNMLSILRIILLPIFVILFFRNALWWAGGVLILSGITDLCDGWIARHFNQVSDAGKLLDPLADKLTQVTVLVCLTTRYKVLIWLLAGVVVKEACQALGAWLLLRWGDHVRGAQWFGKLSTLAFYTGVAALVLFPDMADWLRVAITAAVLVLMIGSFLGYLITYLLAKRALKKSGETDGSNQ